MSGQSNRPWMVPIYITDFLALGFIAFLIILEMWGLQSIPDEPFSKEIWNKQDRSQRKQVIKDLVTNVLPGMTVDEVVAILGPSPTKEQMRRYDRNDLYENVRRGEGHEYDEHEWDLIYMIGMEKIAFWDLEASPGEEHFIIRFDSSGRFESWFIAGSQKWASIVDKDNKSTYKETR